MAIRPDSKIVKISHLVRDEVEKYVISKNKNDEFGMPSYVDDEDLTGACAIASYVLYRVLRKLNVSAKFALGDNHCWVQCSDWVIDLTATQFGYKEKVLFSKILAILKYINR